MIAVIGNILNVYELTEDDRVAALCQSVTLGRSGHKLALIYSGGLMNLKL